MTRAVTEYEMMSEERQKLLNEYAATSRFYSDAVERLRHLGTGEAFIRGLGEAGTAHRACQRSRIRLDKHLSQLQHAAS